VDQCDIAKQHNKFSHTHLLSFFIAERLGKLAGRVTAKQYDETSECSRMSRTKSRYMLSREPSGRVSNARKKVAESKSDRFHCKINEHSENSENSPLDPSIA
jgi:hypothetical protein